MGVEKPNTLTSLISEANKSPLVARYVIPAIKSLLGNKEVQFPVRTIMSKLAKVVGIHWAKLTDDQIVLSRVPQEGIRAVRGLVKKKIPVVTFFFKGNDCVGFFVNENPMWIGYRSTGNRYSNTTHTVSTRDNSGKGHKTNFATFQQAIKFNPNNTLLGMARMSDRLVYIVHDTSAKDLSAVRQGMRRDATALEDPRDIARKNIERYKKLIALKQPGIDKYQSMLQKATQHYAKRTQDIVSHGTKTKWNDMGIDGKAYTDLSRPYEKLMSQYGTLLGKFAYKKNLDKGIDDDGNPIPKEKIERSLDFWSDGIAYYTKDFKKYYDEVMAF